MQKGRIEAFSDGVIAIIITIMVLELKVPYGHNPEALIPLIPVYFAYVLSFVNIGIYWNNNNHMFQAVKHVGGWVRWANLHLLFWLSLLPFVTGFIGKNDAAPGTVLLYCTDLLMCGVAYFLLERALIAQHGKDSAFARSLHRSKKDITSVAANVLAIAVALFRPLVSLGLVVLVALMWVVPDRRFKPQTEA
jgi:uncharacterized membrane protein